MATVTSAGAMDFLGSVTNSGNATLSLSFNYTNSAVTNYRMIIVEASLKGTYTSATYGYIGFGFNNQLSQAYHGGQWSYMYNGQSYNSSNWAHIGYGITSSSSNDPSAYTNVTMYIPTPATADNNNGNIRATWHYHSAYSDPLTNQFSGHGVILSGQTSAQLNSIQFMDWYTTNLAVGSKATAWGLRKANV